jgi:hypothetical protein
LVKTTQKQKVGAVEKTTTTTIKTKTTVSTKST